jgi:DNA-binding NarL/FixJ family response regulator
MATPPRNSEGIKVLLIDTHDNERSRWMEQLQRYGYVVHEAASGEAGLELHRSQPFDCVVTDLALPNMTGYEVLLALVPLASEPVPVLILTRIDSPMLRDLAVKNGARAYLVKSRVSGDDLNLAILKAISDSRSSSKEIQGDNSL